MQSVIKSRVIGLGVAAALTIAATFSATATFESSAPGLGLEPVGGAERLISLIQGQQHLAWSALAGSVTSLRVAGWPSSSGDVELGGGVMIERPSDGEAGIIAFGEKPMSLEFQLNG